MKKVKKSGRTTKLSQWADKLLEIAIVGILLSYLEGQIRRRPCIQDDEINPINGVEGSCECKLNIMSNIKHKISRGKEFRC